MSSHAGVPLGIDLDQDAAGAGRFNGDRSYLVGLEKSVQIVPIGAKDSDIVNMAAIAAYNASV